jgi:flagellar secretion chaperone FliS
MNPALQAQQAYRQNSVLSASPEQLVLMLYDGALRFLRQAAVAMREADVTNANGRLRRAEAILDELRVTLDPSAGELAERLDAIYVFCRQLLVQAQLEQDPSRIEAAVDLIGELRDAWAAICA